ncbi:MAG: general secretion pathway protein D [Myxococcota bacterium]|jgi:general secretion pathway protein D
MASATMAIAQTDPVGGRGEPVELILVDMPLGDIVKAIADRTGNDYVYEPPLPGRMTVAVPSRVSRQEATEILNAALLIKGFVALPIAPNRFAISRWEKMSGSAPYTTRALDLGAEGAITTRIQLRHADPESVARALRPLLQDKGEAIPHAPSGSIILAGTENRIARLIGIARQLDLAAEESMIVIRLRYREAAEVRDQLSTLVTRNAGAGSRKAELDAIVDERTNALFLTGSPSELKQLREWIEIMDVPAAGNGEIHVVHLVHQNPEEFASLLESQSQTQGSSVAGAQTAVDAGPLIGKHYSVTPYKATRSIVVRSDRTTFESIRYLIGKLDREPRMIRVDVNIYEIVTDGTLALGAGGVIPAIEPKQFDDLGLVALVNPGLLDIPDVFPGLNFGGSPVQTAATPTFQVQGESTVIPIFDESGRQVTDGNGIPQVVLVPGLGITMFSQDVSTEIEIVQRPSLMIEVGKEAELFVGDNIPIPVGSNNDIFSQFAPTIGVTIERVDVGVNLRLKPVVASDEHVRLELNLELDLVRGAASPELGPILANRKVETTFDTGFGQRMIIAGMNNESKVKAETRIPFLSAIPFFGQFFTATLDSLRRNYVIYSVDAYPVPSSEEQQAQTEAMARAAKRLDTGLEAQAGAQYAIRVASYYTRAAAEAVESELDVHPWKTTILRRERKQSDRFDLFVLGLPRMSDVALTAVALEREGFRPGILTLTRNVTSVR